MLADMRVTTENGELPVTKIFERETGEPCPLNIVASKMARRRTLPLEIAMPKIHNAMQSESGETCLCLFSQPPFLPPKTFRTPDVINDSPMSNPSTQCNSKRNAGGMRCLDCGPGDNQEALRVIAQSIWHRRLAALRFLQGLVQPGAIFATQVRGLGHDLLALVYTFKHCAILQIAPPRPTSHPVILGITLVILAPVEAVLVDTTLTPTFDERID